MSASQLSTRDLSWLTARPIAHRGFHDVANNIAENSASAFDRAAAHNFTIELDVQVTADGKAAVFHDYELDRLTDQTGRVDTRTMAELSAITLKHSTDQIEEFSEFLQRINGRVPLVIELKPPKTNDKRLETAVTSCLESYNGKAAVMSFSPDVVQNLKALTDRPCGIVSCLYDFDEDGEHLTAQERYHLSHLLHASQSKPDFISYKQQDLPSPAADLLKALWDIPVICWTITDEESHKRALRYCDQVTFEGYNPDEIA